MHRVRLEERVTGGAITLEGAVVGIQQVAITRGEEDD